MKIVIGPSTDMNVLDIAVAAKAYDFSVVEVRVLVKLRLLLVAVCALFCCFSLGFWHVCVCVYLCASILFAGKSSGTLANSW